MTQQMAVLKQQAQEDPGAATHPQQAARRRAAVDKKQRLQAAPEAAREVQPKREDRERLHPSEAEERKSGGLLWPTHAGLLAFLQRTDPSQFAHSRRCRATPRTGNSSHIQITAPSVPTK